MNTCRLAIAILWLAWEQPSIAQGLASDPVPIGDRAMWVQAADWPVDLRQREIEGNVSTGLTISPAGFVTDCAIVQSSGFEAMDNIACTRLRQRGQFEPARDSNGEAITGYYETTIVFRFNDKKRIPKEGSIKRIMIIEKDGTVSDCSLETATPDAIAKQRACSEDRAYRPMLDDDGNPVRVRVTSERIDSREILAD